MTIKSFVKKHPSAWRYISILGIVALLFPTFFIGNFCGDGGRYFALAVYALIGVAGAYEVLKNLNVSKWVAGIVSLVVLVMFFFPKDTFLMDSIRSDGWGNNIPAATVHMVNWKSIIVVGLAPLILLFDKKMWQDSTKMVPQLLIASLSMILISIFAKFIWVVNIVDYVQLFYFLPIAIIADSFGYLGGKYLKKYIFNGKKLAPKLSPKKTWAGFIIGYIFSAIFVGVVGWAMGIYSQLGNEVAIIVIMSLLLPIVSPLGDLMFSGIKRYLGIKDFSNLMPGHGGIMDRVDAMSSVIFVLFIVFAIVI